tara:strand:- start:885 stop:1256 length:372 start_codon:yes stop_codon:yes gene_type:complete
MNYFKKRLLFLMKIFFKIGIIFMALSFACSGERSKKSQDNEVLELREWAHRLSQKLIITHGHIDLPYRMANKGFMSRNSVEDVSINTMGDFDYPKAKLGGLDDPFMSIYVDIRPGSTSKIRRG